MATMAIKAAAQNSKLNDSLSMRSLRSLSICLWEMAPSSIETLDAFVKFALQKIRASDFRTLSFMTWLVFIGIALEAPEITYVWIFYSQVLNASLNVGIPFSERSAQPPLSGQLTLNIRLNASSATSIDSLIAAGVGTPSRSLGGSLLDL